MANLSRTAKSGSSWTLQDLQSYHNSLNQADAPVLRRTGQRLARKRVDLPLLICGEKRHAKTNVCVADGSQNMNTILVVQAVSSSKLNSQEPVNAREQLVAEAVTAFNQNNVQRENVGLPPVEEKVMAGIVMVGSTPEFFKTPVTQILSTHPPWDLSPRRNPRDLFSSIRSSS
ncbi:hypothetical protein DXG03_004440 [Asterophora parasitica]|uniref:Uncharacterized protein n=1 Tax=Asterophora parasitica TaxID=117018 RepID=A0A9P7G6M3_9AGAR|nr:hypothetical protein DXG03_004440 [Asterophora parasitica]